MDLATLDIERNVFVARMEKHWQQQQERIMAALDLKALPDVFGAFDSEAETAALTPIVQGHMQRLAEIGAWDVLAEWNPTSDGWSPAMIEAWIAKAASTNAGKWTHVVENGLTNAAQQEDPVEALKVYLGSEGRVTGFSVSVATEAHSFGGGDAARKSGLSTKTWHVHSRKPRKTHAMVAGETVGIDETFGNGLRWPGDSSAGAGESANCTCSLTYGKEE